MLKQFVGPDIKREVKVLDNAKLKHSKLTVQSKTWNVLYVCRGFAQESEFGEAYEIDESDLWRWPGNSWGGPVPTGIDGPHYHSD